ncbi:unnamed protein product, partial [Pleuronectes platessa]
INNPDDDDDEDVDDVDDALLCIQKESACGRMLLLRQLKLPLLPLLPLRGCAGELGLSQPGSSGGVEGVRGGGQRTRKQIGSNGGEEEGEGSRRRNWGKLIGVTHTWAIILCLFLCVRDESS